MHKRAIAEVEKAGTAEVKDETPAIEDKKSDNQSDAKDEKDSKKDSKKK